MVDHTQRKQTDEYIPNIPVDNTSVGSAANGNLQHAERTTSTPELTTYDIPAGSGITIPQVDLVGQAMNISDKQQSEKQPSLARSND